MTHSQLDSLIHMANQIAVNHRHHGSDDQAAAEVASHLRKFWARSMKRQIVDYLHADGSQLDPVARLAIERLAAELATASPTGAA